MISDIETYFQSGCGRCNRFDSPDCSARIWKEGLEALRSLCHSTEMDEVVKWGHPCYVHAGRNIAVIGAFRADFRLSFFEAGLMQDPDGLLVRQGAKTAYPDALKFCSRADVDAASDTIVSYLREAMGYAEEGRRAAKPETAMEWPAELTEALDCDAELAEAFHALTPGRQRSYLINLNGAKRAETRTARITKFRDKILAGKGALER